MEVGVKIDPNPQKVKIALIKFLSTLHASDIKHGDPRIQNLVNVNGQYKWIDVRPSTVSSYKDDMTVLIHSLYGSNVAKHENIVTLLDNYNNAPTPENCEILANTCKKFGLNIK
mmetsp:Transcript_19219/g.17449  ORF Transcript_19219/g.17449 Transcript_19219/m.17449 type:complete len:114 (+) Transcript_19219:764-1105(+)